MITAALLRSWKACWDDDKIAAHFGSRRELTPREIAADESISLDDRLWVLTHYLAQLDESAARLYAIECAETVTHLAGDDDDQAQHAGILNDLICAEDLPDAARDAARDAAWYAARYAARDAAWYAARDAAWYAARGAAIRDSIARALHWLGDYADGRQP